jgi:ribonuclease J
MRRMVQVAMETGVLKDFPPTIGHEEALAVPRENLMLLVTGSQGERRAASAQLSQGKYLGLEMKAGDLFLFSSKTIPGNEVHVGRIANNFSEMGVDVVDDSSGAYHVSGHANRPDLEAVHELMKPEILLPMHGEHRHLREHAKLGTARGIASLVAVNGTMVDLTTARPEIVEHVETGRTYLDGTRLLGAMDGVVRDRIRMALNGHVVVGVVIDEEGGLLGDAWVETMGLAKAGRSNAPLAERIEAAIGRDLSNVSPKVLDDDEKLESALRRTVRHVALEEIGKKPEVTVLISRLLDE